MMNLKAIQKFLSFTPEAALVRRLTSLLFFTLVYCFNFNCADSQTIQHTKKADTFDWNDWHPAWSPNGDKIVFNSHRDGNYEIYIMNVDGSSQSRLTNQPAQDMRPTWSPDGTKIVFNSNRDGNHEIYIMDADGANPTRLTNNPGSDRRASWSPDGSKIVFDSNRDGNTEIYIMNADGTSPVRLTNSPTRDDYPDWSPDGAKIVFNSGRDGNGEIYVMNADGSNQTPLTVNTATDQAPRWSFDGMHIVYFSTRDGDPEIYVMDADGSNQKRLTASRDWDFMPYFSPDGKKIVFDSRRDGRRGIYIMNTDGSQPAKLTNKLLSELVMIARKGGIQEAINLYRETKTNYPEKTIFLESELMTLGFDFLDNGRLTDAVEIFKLNTDAYPASSSAYGNFLNASKQAGRDVPRPENDIFDIFRKKGIEKGIAVFHKTKADYPDWQVVTEGGFNRLGYEFLNSEKTEDAIEVFALNVSLHPESFNVYDSLGEAYMNAGDKRLAIENYEKSLELNPDNKNAAAQLKKLKGEFYNRNN